MDSDDFDIDDLVVKDNEDLFDKDEDFSGRNEIIVYSRDWTVETVISQIKNGNIDLNPKFQRRNAWNDRKKSRLIESYIVGYPVPEIVLAENPREKKKFIVIDGKQRLLTLCGFVRPDDYGSWNSPKIQGLKDLDELNDCSFEDMKGMASHASYIRELANADVRCTVISNVKNDAVLYDIFYRLNAGATPLSVQELRQVLYPGPFTEFMVEYTDCGSAIQSVLKLDGPDNRLKDIETLLRVLAFHFYAKDYRGSLKAFLDNFTHEVNEGWGVFESKVVKALERIEFCIGALGSVLGGSDRIGRRFDIEKGRFESRFNTVLFEVQVFYALRDEFIGKEFSPDQYIRGFSDLCQNPDFSSSISSTTKSISAYTDRYTLYSKFLMNSLGVEIESPWIQDNQ
tara:strand:+ start:4226 stop:5419 length:1194 start_codon:yes stop_codon:yes gene_type:complete